jgi:hypothetical protein
MEANENIIVTNVTFKQSGRIVCLFMCMWVENTYAKNVIRNLLRNVILPPINSRNI